MIILPIVQTVAIHFVRPMDILGTIPNINNEMRIYVTLARAIQSTLFVGFTKIYSFVFLLFCRKYAQIGIC